MWVPRPVLPLVPVFVPRVLLPELDPAWLRALAHWR